MEYRYKLYLPLICHTELDKGLPVPFGGDLEKFRLLLVKKITIVAVQGFNILKVVTTWSMSMNDLTFPKHINLADNSYRTKSDRKIIFCTEHASNNAIHFKDYTGMITEDGLSNTCHLWTKDESHSKNSFRSITFSLLPYLKIAMFPWLSICKL